MVSSLLSDAYIFTILKKSSERVRGKNFRFLGGEPLWFHSLKKFEGLNLFINAESGSELDTKLLEKLNAKTITRREKHIKWEAESSSKGSPVVDMLLDFASEQVQNDESIIVLTHVTSPFLTPETLEAALQKLNEGYDCVHSVESIRDFCFLPPSGSDEVYRPLNFDPKIVQRTQDIEPVLVSNGAFFAFRRKGLLESRDRLFGKVFFYELNFPEALEIDTEEDFKLAEMVEDYETH